MKPAATIDSVSCFSGITARICIASILTFGIGAPAFAQPTLTEGQREYPITNNPGQKAIYRGQLLDGKRHGQGTLEIPDPNGSTFTGEWRDNKRNGQGAVAWTSGDRYEGDWIDDRRTGQGTYQWASGNQYKGQWQDGKITGHGVMSWPDGSAYEGEWLDGKRHGFGLTRQVNGAVHSRLYLHGHVLLHPGEDLRQLNSVPAGCNRQFEDWALFLGQCTPQGLRPASGLVILVNKETLDRHIFNPHPTGDSTLELPKQWIRIVGKAGQPFDFKQASVQRALWRPEVEVGKAQWQTFYTGPMRGVVMHGKGRCLGEGDRMEPCVMDNGQRVDDAGRRLQ